MALHALSKKLNMSSDRLNVYGAESRTQPPDALKPAWDPGAIHRHGLVHYQRQDYRLSSLTAIAAILAYDCLLGVL
jgi:hypothetical protein